MGQAKETELFGTIGFILDTLKLITNRMVTKEEFTDEIGSLRSEMNHRFAKIDERFDMIDNRFDGLDRRLDFELDRRKQLEVRVTNLEPKAA